MFYNVTTNTEFTNTEPPLLREHGVRVPRSFWWRHFLNPSIYNLVLCVFLFKDTFCNVHCWFAHTELRPTALQRKLIEQIHSKTLLHFLRKTHHSFLACRGTLCNTSALGFGSHFKQQHPQQKAEKCEKRGTKQTVKGTLVYSPRAEPSGQSEARLVRPRLGMRVSGDSISWAALRMPGSDLAILLILGFFCICFHK